MSRRISLLAFMVLMASPAYAACPGGTSPIEPSPDGTLGICVEVADWQPEDGLPDCEVREEESGAVDLVLGVTPGAVRRWTPQNVAAGRSGWLTAVCTLDGQEGPRSAPALANFRPAPVPGTPVLTP